MLRGMLALLVAGILGLVAAPSASAAVTVSLRVSDSVVDEGDRVTFSGTATGARLGSTVRLQRRVGDAWQTVASRTLRTTRSFAFVVTPPRGRPVYRVLKPGALGQPAAASASLRLTVLWQPTLTVRASTLLDAQQRSVTRITLGHTGLGGVTLRERRRVPVADTGSGSTSWEWTGRTVVLPASGTTTVDRVRASRGTSFAYDAPAAGARKAVSSEPVSTEVAPVPYTLSSGPLTLRDLVIGGPAGELASPAEDGDRIRFRFTGQAGQRVVLFNGYTKERVCCPDLYTSDGTLVSWDEDDVFTLPVSGTYHLLFGRDTGHRTIGVREARGR